MNADCTTTAEDGKGRRVQDENQRLVPLFRPDLGRDELESLAEVFASGWIGLGPRTSQFEQALAAYQRRAHGVATNSATAALHLALMVLDLPPGSQVLVPTVTFVSTPHAVQYNRLDLVFVDVRESDLCMDLEDFQARIGPNTRAVIPVHMGGQACAMDEICRIAQRHGVTVVEDVANAQGGEWQGRKLGSWGDIGVFSFEAKKNLTTGDGGMLVFDDPRWSDTLRRLRWVGIDHDTWKRFAGGGASASWYYEVDSLGYKYNMNDIAAAIGLCQLRKLDDANARKRARIRRYLAALEGVGDLYLPPYDVEHGGYWLFIVHTDHRDRLMDYLKQRGVTCGVHFMPCHLHPYYRKRHPEARLPVAERVWKRCLTLPLYAQMTDQDQDQVVDGIRSFFAEQAR